MFQVKALILAMGCALAVALAPHPVRAAESATSTASREYSIAAGKLSNVLAEFAALSGVVLSFDPQMLAGLGSHGLQGNYSVQAGFAHLLSGSGYELVDTGGGRYSLRRVVDDSGAMTLAPVKVTGAAITAAASELQPAYAGEQVARGASVGILGNRDMMDTPFATTAYTRTLMQQQQADSLADVLVNDASVDNTNPRTSRFDQFSIRGFAVLNSDIALNGLYSVLPTYALAVESLERVDVLKGSTAMVNGMAPSGGVGGTINVVSKRAGDTPMRQATARYASDSVLGGHVDLGQRFGDKGAFGVRFNGTYQRGDTPAGNQYQARGLLTLGTDYRSARTRLSADVGHQDRLVESPQERVGVAAAAPVPDARRLDRGYAPDWTYADSRDTYFALRSEYDLADTVMIYGAFGARAGDYAFLRMNVTARDAAGNFSTRPSYFLRDETVSTGEIGLRAYFQTGAVAHAVVLSGTHFEKTFGNLIHNLPLAESNLYQPLDSPAPSLAGLSTHIPKSGEQQLTSLALADTLSAWDERVQLTLGGRLQRVLSDQYSNGVFANRYDERAFTPAGTLLVKPWQRVSVYANYVQGLSEGPTAPDSAENANEVFAPIKSEQVEAGIKIDRGQLGITVSVFQIDKPSGLTDPVTNVYAIDGNQRNRGLEFSVFGEPLSGVRLLTSAMYLDRRLTRTANPLTEGNHAPGTPRYTLNLGAEWDAPFVSGLTLTSRAVHKASQYLDAANQREISGWTTLDLGGRYAFAVGDSPVILRASLTNALDRAYWSSASSNGLTVGAPRTAQLSATFDF